jgi:tripartite-type tricarboxylate transporter receptor subunit TctC
MDERRGNMVNHRYSTLGRILSLFGCLLLVAAWSSSALAAGYPQTGKSIQMLVGYAAGGPSDVGARVLASGLEKELGVSVMTVNKPGANGQIALTQLVQSKPDGYAFATANFPVTITGYLDPERKAVYNRKSFEPLAMQVNDPNIFAVKATSPYKTLKDLVEAAKAKPKTITISSGMMNDEQIGIVRLQKMTGAQFAQVSFTQGTAPSLVALLGGKIDVYCGHPADVIGHVKSGEVRVLGVMDDEDSPFLPGSKTFEAQGYKLYNSSSRGYVLPAGTPKEIVDTLSGAMKKVMATEEHQKRMAEMGLSTRYMGPTEFSKFWDDYETMVKELTPLLK